MTAFIEVYSDNSHIKTHEVAEMETCIGSLGCDLILDYPTVSRKHATLKHDQGRFVLSDLSSKNGTFIRNKNSFNKIEKETTVELHDEILIGPFTLKITNIPYSIEGLNNSEKKLRSMASRYEQILNENHENPSEKFANETMPYERDLAEIVQTEFEDNGPIAKFMNKLECKEILINRHDEIFIDDGDGLKRSDSKFISENTFEAWAIRVANSCGRRLDLQNPICEATLPDGSRFHAVIPPVAHRGISVSIRRFGQAPIDEEKALQSGWITDDSLLILKALVQRKVNTVISGGTSSGKTSLLNFLCRYLPKNERIITIEDTIELTPPVKNIVQLQARKENSDGAGRISLRDLVKSALRMRPDRIIVGECRGDEVLEMLQALNTGHPGSLTTVHANSEKDAIQRLELLCMLSLSNLTLDAIQRWIKSSIECVLHVERDANGRRYLRSIVINRDGLAKLDGLNLEKRTSEEGGYAKVFERI